MASRVCVAVWNYQRRSNDKTKCQIVAARSATPVEYSNSVTTKISATIPSDTSIDVWRADMAAIAAMAPIARLHACATLNRAMAQMQDEAVRRQYPTYNDAQVMRELIKRQYGSKILDDIDNHQNKRRND